MKLINIVSLGCSKNLVDSETILGILSSGGYVVTPSLEDAEIILINTCGFIEPAVKEAVDTIFNCLQFKEKGCCKYVIVLGCLVSRYGEKRLSQLFPEVDGWLGVDAYTVVLQYLDRLIAGEKTQFMESRPCGEYLYPRMLSTPSHTAYLKIAEGCSHACSFCLIPRIRGPLYSKTPDVIYREAEQLAAGGVKELILVAQDSGAYGRDLPGKPTLTELLKNLVKIKDLHWIRFLYMNPYSLTPDLIKTMQEEKKLCNYLDLPLQHVNRNILKSMGRRGDVYSYRKLIKEVKTALPDLVLRTTLMVGYPGEDREAFQELQAFVGHGYFDRLGVFPYYHEEEARSFRYQDTASP
jgi:ribosomal protein S12 methylthiotransferase